jgi:hypothetical protein
MNGNILESINENNKSNNKSFTPLKLSDGHLSLSILVSKV